MQCVFCVLYGPVWNPAVVVSPALLGSAVIGDLHSDTGMLELRKGCRHRCREGIVGCSGHFW